MKYLPANIAVASWCILLLAGIIWLFSNFEMHSDMTLFLPDAHSEKEAMMLDQLRSGRSTRLILMAISGAAPEQLAKTSKILAKELRRSALFASVHNGDNLINDLTTPLLFDYRYLLNADPKKFSAIRLRRALEERLEELGSPFTTAYTRLLPHDPTGEMLGIETRLKGSAAPGQQYGLWFSRDTQKALLIAETRVSGYDLDEQEKAIRKITSSFERLRSNASISLDMTGPAVFGVESRTRIKADSTLLSTIALLLVFPFLFLMLRSAFAIAYIGLAVLTGLVFAVVAVLLVFGSIHGITLAFGITLLGVALDYPVHVLSHLNKGESALQSTRRIWPVLRLGIVTTMLGFSAFLLTSYDGLVQLGLLSVVGIFSAAVYTRWVLPNFPYLQTLRSLPDLRPPGISIRVARSAVFTMVLGAAITIVLLSFRGHDIWENDLAALSPIPPGLIEKDAELRSQIGAPEVSRMLILTGDSPEELLQLAEEIDPELSALEEADLIAHADLLSRILPSKKIQRLRQLELPAASLLAANLEKALVSLPFRDGTFQPFLIAVEKSRNLIPLVPEDLISGAIGLKVASLISETQDGWFLLVPLSGVSDSPVAQDALASLTDRQVTYLDVRSETNAMISGFRDSATRHLVLGALAAMALLYLGLGSGRRLALVILPVALALLLDAGILVGLGQKLSLFHLVSLLLVLGVSLDYSLFFNAFPTSRSTTGRTFRAITVCAISTASVFGVLAISEIPVLRAVGMTVAIGAAGGYIAAFLLNSSMEHETE